MPLTKPDGRRALDRILAPAFVVDVQTISLAELRSRRLLVDHEESWLSYLRRMLHGRIDILEATVAMRRDDGTAQRDLDVASLVATLVDQMGTSAAGGRPLPPHMADLPGGGRRAVEQLIARAGLDEYTEMTDDELDARRDELLDMEREVSDIRRRIHDVHSTLTGELARRYRIGEAAPEGDLRADQ